MQTTHVQQASPAKTIADLKVPSQLGNKTRLDPVLKQYLPLVAAFSSFLAATNADGASIAWLLSEQRPGEPKIDFKVSGGSSTNVAVTSYQGVMTKVDPAVYQGVELPADRPDLSGSTFTWGADTYLQVNSSVGSNAQFTVVYSPATTNFIIGSDSTAVFANLTNCNEHSTYASFGWVSNLVPKPAGATNEVASVNNAQWRDPLDPLDPVDRVLSLQNYSFIPGKGARWTISLNKPGLVTVTCWTNDLNSPGFVLQTNWAPAGVSSYTNNSSSVDPAQTPAAFIRPTTEP